jgi:CheY-like chemotaxis protein
MCAVRFVLCDEDPLIISMVETIVERHGHEVLGIADHTAIASELVKAGRPDAVVVDLSLGYNTDFDIIGTARDVGSRVVVFSHNADHSVLDRFDPRPVVVAKPDFVALEAVIERLRDDDGTGDAGGLIDRRMRPARAAVGPEPAGLHDAQAFYEALAYAADDDAMVSIEAAEGSPPLGEDVARRVQALVRGTDRVLAMATAVRVFLAGPGDLGLDALIGRLAADQMAASGTLAYRSTVVGPGETGAEVFDRLKHSVLRPLR